MNRAKKGEILYDDMFLMLGNAKYRLGKKYTTGHTTEEEYLNRLIQKAESRIQQIYKDSISKDIKKLIQ